ncbi:hypothetical protein RCM47_21595, partial [Escherichia coli]|nr:hypothetical protein [Escherichia coli]
YVEKVAAKIELRSGLFTHNAIVRTAIHSDAVFAPRLCFPSFIRFLLSALFCVCFAVILRRLP